MCDCFSNDGKLLLAFSSPAVLNPISEEYVGLKAATSARGFCRKITRSRFSETHCRHLWIFTQKIMQ